MSVQVYYPQFPVGGNRILAGVIIHCPESRCEVCMNCHGGLLKMLIYRGKLRGMKTVNIARWRVHNLVYALVESMYLQLCG